ncbi:MAG TPA: hypothetical protein VES36_05350 [Candidatus Limnocylindrales bacterium]|nr:hypothetical protein [Candidatus Limnocylindrales bacterium]
MTASAAGNPPIAASAFSLADALAASEVLSVFVDLPSSRARVEVPAFVRLETRWKGPLPSTFGSVPNKDAFAFDGAPIYPELLVVKLLERGGWSAAWRKNWGGVAYWRDIREPITPPALPLTILDQVSRQAGHEVPWDIVAWRGRELRLLVSRVDGGQRLSAYLANWLDAALRMGIPLGCFAIVEHRAERLARRR